jgi:hypothetical protein
MAQTAVAISQTSTFDIIRTLAYTGISGTYAAVGTPSTHRVRAVCFTNNTDGDMLFSYDGVNDYIFVAAKSYKLWDVSTNKETNCNNYQPVGVQWYVKESTAPSMDSVYIEYMYSVGE